MGHLDFLSSLWVRQISEADVIEWMICVVRVAVGFREEECCEQAKAIDYLIAASTLLTTFRLGRGCVTASEAG